MKNPIGRFLCASLLLTAVGFLVVTRVAGAEAADLDFFEKRIRPVLAEKCFKCHAADSEKLKGGLQVDHIDYLLKGGDTGPSIVAGSPGDSLLVEALEYGNSDLQMPPKERLSDAVVKDFRTWIAGGAPWPEEPLPQRDADGKAEVFDLQKRYAEHWCWRQPAPGQVPLVNQKDWPISPIDSYILQRIEQAGLRPAESADDRTWLRRVYFDLIGLPPTREEIESFLANSSPKRREEKVDELLSSPHFGEKWARHWMDLVRYAETYGHEFDYSIEFATEYRDYLIRAFNDDVPYDLFLKEHIAGDLLPEPRINSQEQFAESPLATAFWYMHESTHAPTDVLQHESDRMANQIDVFGKAFQGLTISCARCHDHKFDAISTADYYALTGYLHSSARTERSMDPGQVRSRTAEEQKKLLAKADQKLRLQETGKLADYFRVAAALSREALQSDTPKGDPWSGVVFEDFESGFDRWTASGDAFGEKPLTGAVGNQKPIENFRGKSFANSYALKNDNRQGELKSESFQIEKPFINFLVGGGAHANTAMELRVKGKVVRTASGESVDRFREVSWDVASLIGESAEIRIVDANKGGWGHVIVDHIVFSDFPAAEPGTNPMPTDEQIAAGASANGLESKLLASWCRIFAGAETNLQTPEGFLAEWIRNPEGTRHLKKKVEDAGKAQEDFLLTSTLFEDFESGDLPEGWSVSGESFLPTGAKPGVSFLKRYPVSEPGVMDSGLLGEKHVGVLRSPLFTIKSDRIHVRLRGKDVFARVVMDNYHMARFHTLLFKGTIHKGLNEEGGFQWVSFDADLKKYRGHRAYLEFVDSDHGWMQLDEIRFSDHPAPSKSPHPVVSAMLSQEDPANAFADAMKSPSLFNWLAANELVSSNFLGEEVSALVAKGEELSSQLPSPRFALTMAKMTPEAGHIYIRGSHRNLGEEVPRRYLEALGGKEGDRLDLANQVASPSNPMTARVMVNRIWHHLFGKGIVPSVDDFGPMGQLPTHPELLDWLATDFVDSGWSIKHTIREIVLSRTFAQQSVAHPDLKEEQLAESDPSNDLLHKMPVRRLEAEQIRDAILVISGSLDPEMYGPSVPTYRTEFMTGRGAKQSGPLDGAGRRTIYGAIYRNFLPPFLLTFDMPSPFGPKGRRDVSNVPAQSLSLLNDPFVSDQAENWASKVASSSATTPEERIREMYLAVAGEEPEAESATKLKEFVLATAAGSDTPPQNAWEELAHVLFNTKAFLFLK